MTEITFFFSIKSKFQLLLENCPRDIKINNIAINTLRSVDEKAMLTDNMKGFQAVIKSTS